MLIVILSDDRLTVDLFSIVLRSNVGLEATVWSCKLDERIPPDADCILIDHRIVAQHANMLLLQRMITATGCPTVVFAVPNNPAVIIPYIEMGVRGYVCIDDPVERLLEIVGAISRGEAVLAPDMAAHLMKHLAELYDMPLAKDMDDVGRQVLSPRQEEVLELIGLGYSNKAIAETLGIELGTVKNHVHQILTRLQLGSRRDAAEYVVIQSAEEFRTANAPQ